MVKIVDNVKLTINNEWKETEIGRIPNEWTLTKLDEISSLVTDGAHKSPKQISSEYKMLSVKDMTYGKFDFKNSKTISEKEFEELKRNNCSPKKGDILISKDGANCLDIIFVYNQEEEIVLLSSIAIVRLRKNYDPNFYRYYLLSRNAQYLMRSSYISGTAIPRVILKDFKNVPVPYPPLYEQIKIASILKSLDDKIELNNQMNQTLEEMAQTIFKEWFVEFNFPNEDGVPYKDNDGEMVNSELGMIPKGWRVGTIDEVAEVVAGGTPSKKIDEYFATGKEIAWITPRDLSGYNDKFIGRGTLDITELGLKKSSAKIMPKGTVLFSSRAPIGYIAIAKNEVTTNQGFKSLVPNKGLGTEYLYYMLHSIKDNIENHASGSTFKEVSGAGMKKHKIIIPIIQFADIFEKIVSKLSDMILKNEIEVEALIKTRDTLLPKLMSGEVRV